MESKIVSITIKIGEELFTLPLEEAKQLFSELKEFFEPKPTISVSSVWEPSTKTVTSPWAIRYTSVGEATDFNITSGNTN